jgi:hypothetical protein
LLAAALAPRPLILSNSTNPVLRMVPPAEVSQEYMQTSRCYKVMGQAENFLITGRRPGIKITESYSTTLEP